METINVPFSFYISTKPDVFQNPRIVSDNWTKWPWDSHTHQIWIADGNILLGKLAVKIFVDVEYILGLRKIRRVVVNVVYKNRRASWTGWIGLLYFRRYDHQVKVTVFQWLAIDSAHQTHHTAILVHHEFVSVVFQSDPKPSNPKIQNHFIQIPLRRMNAVQQWNVYDLFKFLFDSNMSYTLNNHTFQRVTDLVVDFSISVFGNHLIYFRSLSKHSAIRFTSASSWMADIFCNHHLLLLVLPRCE